MVTQYSSNYICWISRGWTSLISQIDLPQKKRDYNGLHIGHDAFAAMSVNSIMAQQQTAREVLRA